jgi:peptide/nickel transport system ATP-binding protein
MSIAPALEVRGLRIEIRSERGALPVVQDVSFSLAPGETLCIIGESGCGKSMTALSLLRLLPSVASITSGAIRLGDDDLLALPRHALEDIRGARIAMIFQEPLTALNPVMTIGAQIIEAVRRHSGQGHAAAHRRTLEVLELVGMPEPRRRQRQFPHELSGGMRQRAIIALAISCEPAVLIADEPTTALDVTIQAQILALIRALQRRLGTALLMITHDFGVVAETADRVCVMYAGRIVEEADATALFDNPLHPYTQGLLGATPRFGAGAGCPAPLQEIPGIVPALADLPPGCAFAARCGRAVPRCAHAPPPFARKAPKHWAACWEVPDADP